MVIRRSYGEKWGFVLQFLVVLGIEMLAYGKAALLRQWLSSECWPDVEPIITLIKALHSRSGSSPDSLSPDSAHWRISKGRFLLCVFLISLVWGFILKLAFPALIKPAFITWIWPNNAILNILFGMWSGMSVLPFTFDWAEAAGYYGNPLIIAWETGRDRLIGFVSITWILCPLLFWLNKWHAQYFPFNSFSPSFNWHS